MQIKVFGPGCAKCEEAEKKVKQAVAEAGIEAEVIKVGDIMEIAKQGIFGTPAIMVDGEVKSVGKVPGVEEIKKWLSQ